MSEAWLNFAVVVFVQCMLFVAHAYFAKRVSDVPRLLGMGVLIGIMIGPLYDLVGGNFLDSHRMSSVLVYFFSLLTGHFRTESLRLTLY